MTTAAETNAKTQPAAPPSPERLIQIGTGFWPSKVLLAAVHFDLFTFLAAGPKGLKEIETTLGLHPRSSADFLDTLVALGVLDKQVGLYRNSPESQVFLNRGSSVYIGDMFRMSNERLWEFWGRLEEALRTGRPQNETRHGGDFFEKLYNDPVKLRLFVNAMIGLSAGSSMAVAQRFDFSPYKTFCDVGGGPGTLNMVVARAFPHVQGINFDLPPVGPLFEEYARLAGVLERVRFQGGDCLKDPLPKADVYGFGNLFHGIGEEESLKLLHKAHKALPKGGAVLVIEALIDDERRHNAFGLLMSLDMLIETEKGRNFTGREACAWLAEAGFKETRVEHLAGPFSMAVGVK